MTSDKSLWPIPLEVEIWVALITRPGMTAWIVGVFAGIGLYLFTGSVFDAIAATVAFAFPVYMLLARPY